MLPELLIMYFLSLLLSAIAVSAAIPGYLPRNLQTKTSKTIPAELATGDIVANFISTRYGIDAPQLSAVNNTSFDWWYFDAISSDSLSAVTVIFFTSANAAFPFLSSPNVTTSIVLNYRFPNGTNGTHNINADRAVVETVDSGSSGDWVGTGISWKGSPDLSTYNITIDNPTIGIKGTFNLKSTSPAHYPCGPNEADQTMLVAPHIGWGNAVPDADAKIDWDINGSKLVFEGAGYHDKNWSDQPFTKNVASWYWGHARIASYEIVWLDGLTLNGTEFVSAYASRSGIMITAACNFGALKVRPVESLYPPTIASPDPKSYALEMDLGTEGILALNITTISTLVDAAPIYSRWGGSVDGTLNGGDLLGGHALYEQFKFV